MVLNLLVQRIKNIEIKTVRPLSVCVSVSVSVSVCVSVCISVSVGVCT